MLSAWRRILPATSLSGLAKAVTTFAVTVLYGRVLNRPSPRGPLFVTWHLTFDCNAFCSFCATHKVHKRHPPTLGLERALEIADEIAASGTWVVGFTGGEVLMSPLLFPLVRRLKSRGVTCYLVTNGLLLESLADEVVDSGLDWIVVSIDSDKPAEHDRNRHVEGLFDKALAGIAAVKRLRCGPRPQIKTTTVITRWNLERMIPILDHLGGMVDRASAQPITWGYKDHPHGKSKDSLHSYVFRDNERQMVETAFARLAETYPAFRNRYFRLIPTYWFEPDALERTVPCWSPFLRLSITPEGETVHCAARFPAVGSLADQPLMAAWNSPAMRRQRDLVRRRQNHCICWSQDSSFNALMSSLPLANRLPVIGKGEGE